MIPCNGKREPGPAGPSKTVRPAVNYGSWRRCVLWMLFAAGLVISMSLFFLTGSMAREIKGPPPAANAPGADGSLRLDPGDHCPVCGMFPARRPECAAALQLQDGRTFYFCSNRCLLGAWRNPGIHLGVSADAIKRVIVLDYFNGTPIDGRSAWWIAGSDVIGPMGPSLVTVSTRDNATVFQERHGGSLLFQLDQVDAALWSKLVSPVN
jgi:copper chaperone NosL